MYMKRYILLDVGGTQIKGGTCDEDGKVVGELRHYPSYSKENKEVIFDNVASIVKELLGEDEQVHIWGIGMAFPGPFNYEDGISPMCLF